jgi:calcium load-activated calcium channel
LKKIKDFKKDIQNLNQDLTSGKFTSVIITGFVMFGFIGFLNSLFDGRVVAMLPFEPFSLLQSLTRRNLSGNNLYECGMLFIYVLSNMTFKYFYSFIFIRNNISKFMGIKDNATSMFQAPETENN